MVKMKIAFISMHPAPYRDELIGRIVDNASLDVDVYNYFSFDKGHDFWGLEKARFNATELYANKSSFIRTVWRLLRLFVFSRKYDFVMWPGWTYKPLLIPMFVSALFKLDYGFSADTVEQRKIGWVMFLFKKFLIRRAKMIFVPGAAGKSFFVNTFGVKPEIIIKGAYALDGNALEKKILNRRQSCKDIMRDELGVNRNSKMFLMVANMIHTRCYPITVAGFLEFARNKKDVVFVVVGKGPDLEKMQKIQSQYDCIKVIPGCSFDEMLSLYAAADVYVHGGKEPASTALVIGAISHLPLVSSPAVGCSADVLVDNESGVLVEKYMDPMSWKSSFSKILQMEKAWSELGEKAREASKNLDVENCVQNFLMVVSKVLA